MKKTITLFITVLLMISICACGNDNTAPAPDPTPEAISAPEPALPDDSEARELCDILDRLFGNYRPATAGSSLTLAHSAAELLDWYEKCGSSENVALAASLFAEAKPDYAAAEGDPLHAVYAMAQMLCEPDGDGIVADSGYERQSDAWCAEHTEAFFSGLFAALGIPALNSQ